jgi:hypothetical protein
MAFSSTLVKKGVCGDLVYQIYTWTAGGDSNGTIVTGTDLVYSAPAENDEEHSEAPQVQVNTDSSGTANGSVLLTFADATNNTGRITIFCQNL